MLWWDREKNVEYTPTFIVELLFNQLYTHQSPEDPKNQILDDLYMSKLIYCMELIRIKHDASIECSSDLYVFAVDVILV